MLFTTTASDEVTDMWLGDLSTTSSPQHSDSNVTRLSEENILETLRELKIDTLEPTIAYIVILMLIGIPGNSLVLYIYLKVWKRNTIRIFIIVLAILDISCCLFVHPMELVIIHNPYVFDYPGICKLFRFSTYTINSTSSLILIIIAADRYHRICRPLKKHITPKIAKIICPICVGIAVFFTWPALVIYGIDKIKISRPEGNATATTCLIEHGYKNTPYPKIFFIILFLATVSTFVALCVLYAIVGCNIFRSRSKWTHSGSSKTWSTESRTEESDVFRNNGDGNNKKDQARSITPVTLPKILTSPSEVRPNADGYTAVTQDASAQDSSNKDRTDPKREIFSPKPVTPDSAAPRQRRFTFSVPRISADKKTTLMLFVITVVYVITFLPFLALATYRTMSPKFTSLSASWEAIYQLTLRSYLINSAVNPFIYSFCNGVFRYECKKLFKTVLRCKTR